MNKVIIKLSSLKAPERDLIKKLHPELVPSYLTGVDNGMYTCERGGEGREGREGEEREGQR
jgi:hypothetical protein